jgi:hypothetical protein
MCLKEIVAPIKKELDASLALDENKFCSCMLDKVKLHYRSYEAVRTSDNSELGEKINRDCAMKSINLGGMAPEAGADEASEEAPKEEEAKK